VTSVKFSGDGDQVIASYSGDNIYSFDCVDHARESEGYCTAQGWSRQAHDLQHTTTHGVTKPVTNPVTNPQQQMSFAHALSRTRLALQICGMMVCPHLCCSAFCMRITCAAQTSVICYCCVCHLLLLYISLQAGQFRQCCRHDYHLNT